MNQHISINNKNYRVFPAGCKKTCRTLGATGFSDLYSIQSVSGSRGYAGRCCLVPFFAASLRTSCIRR